MTWSRWEIVERDEETHIVCKIDVIGICAMDKKARSKPMRYILDKIMTYGDFEIVIFGDKTILDEGMT